MVDGQITSNKLVSESEKLCTYLKSCQIFSGLTVAQLTEVADKMLRERHVAGDARDAVEMGVLHVGDGFLGRRLALPGVEREVRPGAECRVPALMRCAA